MCGIAGMVVDGRGGRAIEPAVLRRMAAVLRHRGPDGWGMYLDGHAGLAHTRLSIVDLGGGAQPLANEDGTVWVTFNGEIFNHVELRRELEGRGHRFATRCDTEVIVHAYEQWGAACWERFNGQFALGLWDGAERRLWLVRDGVGIAPLFYAERPGAVVFGSEVKAVLASGEVEYALEPAAVAAAFTLWAAPEPATVFRGVRAVEPGTAVCFDAELRRSVRGYWRPRFEPVETSAARSTEVAAAELGERLRTAVDLRLRADVPVGAYISGGLDSSVIAALARESVGPALQTFSLRFEDPRFDETEAQRAVAGLLGTEHHEIEVSPRGIAGALPRVVWHAETPLMRTGPAPMLLLSGLVRRSGMKVVLTGEGADELMGGYDVFKEARVRRFWARRPESGARPALLSRVHPYIARGSGAGMWREFFRNGMTATGDVFYSHRPRWDTTAWATRFLGEGARAAAAGDLAESFVSPRLDPAISSWSVLGRAQAIEMAVFLSPYLLSSQGERMAMAHGVEARYPFLDPGVVGLCEGLPDRQKMCGLREKVVLRELAGRILPRGIAGRRKWPYRAPIWGALFGENAPEDVRGLLSPQALAGSGMIEAGPASALVGRFVGRAGGKPSEREEMALTGLLTLQMLGRMFGGELSARVEGAVGELSGSEPDVLVDRRRAGRGVPGAAGGMPGAARRSNA